jgi:hypothetical protein
VDAAYRSPTPPGHQAIKIWGNQDCRIQSVFRALQQGFEQRMHQKFPNVVLMVALVKLLVTLDFISWLSLILVSPEGFTQML